MWHQNTVCLQRVSKVFTMIEGTFVAEIDTGWYLNLSEGLIYEYDLVETLTILLSSVQIISSL